MGGRRCWLELAHKTPRAFLLCANILYAARTASTSTVPFPVLFCMIRLLHVYEASSSHVVFLPADGICLVVLDLCAYFDVPFSYCRSAGAVV